MASVYSQIPEWIVAMLDPVFESIGNDLGYAVLPLCCALRLAHVCPALQ